LNQKQSANMKDNIVAQVCCTRGHCAILMKNGRVYSMGKNQNGQLGLGHMNDILSPSLIDPKYFNHERIAQVSTNYHHTMMLTQKGCLYACGNDPDKKIKLIDSIDHTLPQKIDSSYFNDEPIVYICFASIASCCFVVTKSNKIYACGENENYQLGIGCDTFQHVPKLIDASTFSHEKVKKIVCAQYSTCLLTEDGCLYSCGGNIFGQLGTNDEYNYFSKTFKPIKFKQNNSKNNDLDEKIIDIQVGHFHVMALTKSGNVYSWGENDSGECGINDAEIKRAPHLIDASYFQHEKINFIGCGSLCSIAVASSGRVYVWGLLQETFHLIGNKKAILNWHDELCIPYPSEIDVENWKHQKITSVFECAFSNGAYLIVSMDGKLYRCGRYGGDRLQTKHILGESHENKKTYNNVSFEDVSIEF